MSIVRPRLNDFHGLPFRQEDVDFAIPFVDEDIPLFIDPFLLWKSPSMQDNSLHLAITNSINYLGHRFREKPDQAIDFLNRCSECSEIGLGTSKFRVGKKIGPKSAESILSLYKLIELGYCLIGHKCLTSGKYISDGKAFQKSFVV